MCRCLQVQDVELPALLIVQHLGDGRWDIVQCYWDGQLALAHIWQRERGKHEYTGGKRL